MRRSRWLSICGMATGIGIALALLCGCMSTGYRSDTYYPDGKIKSSRHVYNATVWHDAIKGTFNSAVDGLAEFAGTPLGIGLLSMTGLGGTAFGVRQISRAKEKSHNHGLKLGAQIKAGP